MRKITILIILLLLAASLATAGDKRLAIRLSACGLRPADANYRNIYGKTMLLPRMELAYNHSTGLSVWAAFGSFKESGKGPLSGIDCNSAQRFFSAGPAYTMALSRSVALRWAAGLLLVSYREEAGASAVSGNALGADVNATLSWSFIRRLALEGRLGYLLAADRIAGGDKFKLGGLWGGLGLAVSF